MSVWRSKDMNYVYTLIHHGCHRWEYFGDIEAIGQSCSAGVHNVGDSHNARVRHSLNSACVKFADIAGANQSDAETCIWKHSGFPSNLLTVAIQLFHLGECSG